jgi:XTP/dITP diphosphohydrolase
LTTAHRLARGDVLMVASHNPGKAREIRELVAPFGLAIRSAAEFGLPEPEETGATFEENARIKSLAAARASGLPALADDSGLSVDALGGKPGLYSGRWAGPTKDFGVAMREVEKRLQALGATTPEKRHARFVAVLSLAWPDGASEEWRGEVEGTLVWPPRGDKGFGYDPMFLPDGHRRTFGEMSAEEKHGWKPGEGEALSHRARAFARFARDKLGVRDDDA